MKKHNGLKEKSLPVRALIGILISISSLLLCSFLGAIALNSTDDPLRYLSVGALSALFISAALSALIISKALSDGGSLLTLISSISFSLILILSSLISSGAGSLLRTAISAVCYVAIALLASRIFTGKRGRHRRA